MGRFIDIRGSNHNGLSEIPAHGHCFIAAVDVRQMLAERPHLFRLLVEDLVTGFQEKVFRPLPVATLKFREWLDQADAFGADPLAESIALTVDDTLPDAIQAEAARIPAPLFNEEGTYLVTGGFGGFGGEIAKWLVGHGARHLVLVSRRGAATNEAKQLIRHLEKAGATVLGLAADVSKEPHGVELLTRVSASMPPLRGIFHAAGVLDDHPMAFLERTHFANVMCPKALGAWYLHTHSSHLSLAHFVLFSSIGSLIGNPGQAPYVVANAFLDALAHLRRAKGLPAISINWGALSGVGMVAAHRDVKEYFNRVGVGSFSPKQALALLERILVWNPIQIGAAIFDWPLWGQYNPRWATSPRYQHLIGSAANREASTSGNALHRMLMNMPQEERLDTITGVLIDLVAATMHLPKCKIDRKQSLINIGIDSLMAMELQTAIEKQIGSRISTLELLKGNAIEQLAALMLPSSQIAGAARHRGPRHLGAKRYPGHLLSVPKRSDPARL
jgi:acyl carrier protein